MTEEDQKAQFCQAMNVSRETLQKFELWQTLLKQWSTRINLVSPATLGSFWHRHALDGAQLARHMPKGVKTCIDLGSGAGFPGLAIALMQMQSAPVFVTLVEANAKKAAFLRTCIEAIQAPVTVICARAEALPRQVFDVITARALAPLSPLLAVSEAFAGTQSIRLFCKGVNVQKELDEARKHWVLRYERLPSLTSKDSVILKIREARRV